MLPGIRRVLAVMALTVSIAAGPAAGPASAAPCPNDATAGYLLDAPTFERAVVCVINRERSLLNRRPMRANATLRTVASRYAARMVWEGFFAHRSPDGSSILSRVLNSGYLEDATEWQVGENLIWAEDANATARAVVQGWMLSPSHRENLLRPVFREVGVGVALGTPYAPDDLNAITVANEYGARIGPRPAEKGKGKGKAEDKADDKGKAGHGPEGKRKRPKGD